MYHTIVEQLHQHCREKSSVSDLAFELNWSHTQLAHFFEGKNPTIEEVVKVAHAMDLKIDVKIVAS